MAEPSTVDLVPRLEAILAEDGPGALAIAATSLRGGDLAEALENADRDQRERLFLSLPPDIGAKVLEIIEPDIRDQLLEASSDGHMVRILTTAEADDAIYFLEHLDEERAEHLLSLLGQKLRAQLTQQYELPEDAAGRIMTREIVTLRPFMTAAQAKSLIQGMKEANPLYVVDAEGHLAGVVGFRDLVFAKPGTTIGHLMERDVVAVHLEEDREEVAKMLQRYDWMAIPVIDDEQRLCGIITIDEAIDVFEAEAHEDMLHLAGTSETLEDNPSILNRVGGRFPWLAITAFGGFIIAMVIDGQKERLMENALLLAFLPLVPALGGNIGIQSATITVRSIATGDIGAGHMFARMSRELGTGLVLAIIMASLCGLGALALTLATGQDPGMALIIGASMLIAVIIAAAFGVLIPVGCMRIKVDPALAAGPFITCLNDIAGVSIYLIVARILLAVLH